MSTSDDGSFAQEARTQTLKAVVLIVVAVLVAVLLLHRTGSSGTTVASRTTKATVPASAVPTTSTTTPITVPPAQVKVLVLNGTLKGDLAGELTTKLKDGPGYTTVTPDNTTSAVSTSAVYATSTSFAAEAQSIAMSLGLPTTEVFSSLPGTVPISSSEKTEANVIVVIGPDLATRLSSVNLGPATTTTTAPKG